MKTILELSHIKARDVYKRQTLDNMDKNLVDWYSSYLISRKDKPTEHIQNAGCRRILFQGNFHNAYV